MALARVGEGAGIPDYATDTQGHSKYWQHLRNALVAANRDLPPAVMQELRALKISAFAPIKSIGGPVKVKAPNLFDIATVLKNGVPAPQFVIDGKQYDPARLDYKATLGTTDQWTVIASLVGGHVFHIHTNPFQIIDIRNAGGQSIFDANGDCTAAELATQDTQYCKLRGVVRDTLFIKPGYSMVMRTKYEDYTGEFVMHCHILDHEDQGMMQNVSIVAPGASTRNRARAPSARAASSPH